MSNNRIIAKAANTRKLCYNQGMKKELMEILACPVCHGELELRVTEQKDNNIITGTLTCKKCKEKYQITESIPNLLPPGAK